MRLPKKPSVPKRPAPTEHQIQEAIVDALSACGLTVLHTTAYRQKGSSGVSKGVPDLLVYHGSAPCGVALGLEVKREGAVRFSSPEQQELAKRGHVIVVQSPLSALAAAKTFLQIVSPPRLGQPETIARIESVMADLARGPKVSA